MNPEQQIIKQLETHRLEYDECVTVDDAIAIVKEVMGREGEQSNEVEAALRNLVELKNHKDLAGKTLFYEHQQLLAWERAREALENR